MGNFTSPRFARWITASVVATLSFSLLTPAASANFGIDDYQFTEYGLLGDAPGPIVLTADVSPSGGEFAVSWFPAWPESMFDEGDVPANCQNAFCYPDDVMVWVAPGAVGDNWAHESDCTTLFGSPAGSPARACPLPGETFRVALQAKFSNAEVSYWSMPSRAIVVSPAVVSGWDYDATESTPLGQVQAGNDWLASGSDLESYTGVSGLRSWGEVIGGPESPFPFEALPAASKLAGGSISREWRVGSTDVEGTTTSVRITGSAPGSASVLPVKVRELNDDGTSPTIQPRWVDASCSIDYQLGNVGVPKNAIALAARSKGVKGVKGVTSRMMLPPSPVRAPRAPGFDAWVTARNYILSGILMAWLGNKLSRPGQVSLSSSDDTANALAVELATGQPLSALARNYTQFTMANSRLIRQFPELSLDAPQVQLFENARAVLRESGRSIADINWNGLLEVAIVNQAPMAVRNVLDLLANWNPQNGYSVLQQSLRANHIPGISAADIDGLGNAMRGESSSEHAARRFESLLNIASALLAQSPAAVALTPDARGAREMALFRPSATSSTSVEAMRNRGLSFFLTRDDTTAPQYTFGQTGGLTINPPRIAVSSASNLTGGLNANNVVWGVSEDYASAHSITVQRRDGTTGSWVNIHEETLLNGDTAGWRRNALFDMPATAPNTRFTRNQIDTFYRVIASYIVPRDMNQLARYRAAEQLGREGFRQFLRDELRSGRAITRVFSSPIAAAPRYLYAQSPRVLARSSRIFSHNNQTYIEVVTDDTNAWTHESSSFQLLTVLGDTRSAGGSGVAVPAEAVLSSYAITSTRGDGTARQPVFSLPASGSRGSRVYIEITQEYSNSISLAQAANGNSPSRDTRHLTFLLQNPRNGETLRIQGEISSTAPPLLGGETLLTNWAFAGSEVDASQVPHLPLPNFTVRITPAEVGILTEIRNQLPEAHITIELRNPVTGNWTPVTASAFPLSLLDMNANQDRLLRIVLDSGALRTALAAISGSQLPNYRFFPTSQLLHVDIRITPMLVNQVTRNGLTLMSTHMRIPINQLTSQQNPAQPGQQNPDPRSLRKLTTTGKPINITSPGTQAPLTKAALSQEQLLTGGFVEQSISNLALVSETSTDTSAGFDTATASGNITQHLAKHTEALITLYAAEQLVARTGASWGIPTDDLIGDSASWEVTYNCGGLKPETTYQFKVPPHEQGEEPQELVVRTSVGDGLPQFSGAPPTAPAIDGYVHSYEGSNGTVVATIPVPDKNAVYRAWYVDVQGTTYRECPEMGIPTESGRITCSNLPSNATYAFRIQKWDPSYGPGAWSDYSEAEVLEPPYLETNPWKPVTFSKGWQDGDRSIRIQFKNGIGPFEVLTLNTANGQIQSCGVKGYARDITCTVPQRNTEYSVQIVDEGQERYGSYPGTSHTKWSEPVCLDECSNTGPAPLAPPADGQVELTDTLAGWGISATIQVEARQQPREESKAAKAFRTPEALNSSQRTMLSTIIRRSKAARTAADEPLVNLVTCINEKTGKEIEQTFSGPSTHFAEVPAGLWECSAATLRVADKTESNPINLGFVDVPGTPTSPQSTQVTEVSPSKATITWEAPKGQAITHFTATLKSGGSALQELSTKGNAIEIHDLDGGTEYEVTVQAHNRTGVGPSSHAAQFTTPPGPPRSPSGLVAEAVATTPTLKLTWNPPQKTGGSPITGYLVECRSIGSLEITRTVTTEPTATNASIKAGVQGAKHNCTVQALNKHGESAPAVVRVTSSREPSTPENITFHDRARFCLFTKCWVSPVILTTWDPPRYWGSVFPFALNYNIQTSRDKGATWRQMVSFSGAVTAALIEVNPGDLVRIQAVNWIPSSSAWSAPEVVKR